VIKCVYIDVCFSPLVQFQLLHSKFHLCSLATRQLMLSTYVKFVNLFPEIKTHVQQVNSLFWISVQWWDSWEMLINIVILIACCQSLDKINTEQMKYVLWSSPLKTLLLVSVNEVALHQARLRLGWMTADKKPSHWLCPMPLRWSTVNSAAVLNLTYLLQKTRSRAVAVIANSTPYDVQYSCRSCLE